MRLAGVQGIADRARSDGVSNHARQDADMRRDRGGPVIYVAWERAEDDPLFVKPVTAFDSNPPKRQRRGE